MSAAIDQLLNGEWLEFFTGTAIKQTSEGVMALFLVAIVILPLWYRSGHVTIPAVLLVLFSGLLIPMVPGQVVGVLWGVVWIGGTLALYTIIDKAR